MAMAETIEPPIKKAKMADSTETIDQYISNILNSKKSLEAVLSDGYYEHIPMIKVYAGAVKDTKQLSKAVLLLNQKVPLKELQHLKRVHKSCVLLCPTNFLSAMTQESIQEYIEQNVYELKDSFEYFRDVDVPLLAPKTRKQYLECTRTWSCNFHPNKYLERLMTDDFFREEQSRSHRLYMGMAFDVAAWYLNRSNSKIELKDLLSINTNAAVVVDPSCNSVVTVAFDNRETHPLQHSAMLAIDNVAKTQDGGAWTTDTAKVDGGKICGIDKDLLLYLKKKFPAASFGAKKFLCKRELTVNGENLNNGPYLCTGYFVYLLREPCVMCAMGLIHARTKRVFFSFENQFQGALKSIAKLHCVPSLNHHFEVFTGF